MAKLEAKIRVSVKDPTGLGNLVQDWRRQARETADPERMALLIEHADAVARCLKAELDDKRPLRLPAETKRPS